MFSSSSHSKQWVFRGDEEINERRKKANSSFIGHHGKGIKRTAEESELHFLSPEEERTMCRQYEYSLKDFCKKFQPPMPKGVMGTSFHYFKRYYLNNSVMDIHPKEILVTCVYLACKVEEFNVSISQFVSNLRGDREKATDIILNNELILMQQLNYHLTVHNPFRPMEGYFIDIKTRCKELSASEVDNLRPESEAFLDRCFFTDAILVCSPSQLALAAIVNASSKCEDRIQEYIENVLLGPSSKSNLPKLWDKIQKIRAQIKQIELPQKNQVKLIEKKLEKCRNQENNPDSQAYKRKMQEMLDLEEDRQANKYAKVAEEQRLADEEFVGGKQFT